MDFLWTPYLLALALVSLTGSWILILRRRRIQRKRALYQHWIQRARNERDAKEHKVLSEPNIPDALPLYSAVETKASILNGTLDVRLNVAFLSKRCRRFGRESGLNAITEEFYDEAAHQAENLRSKSSLTKIPELYGIPICVKECIGLKGSYSTGGLACRLRCRDSHDALIIQVLRSAGAIPLVCGNVTQIMMLPEAVNRIWGRSLNPWDNARTPGGSSGGDAALVAKGCVPLSVSSDVAGSIRIPASFCGVVGFKPTSTRLSGKGCMVPRLHDKGGTRVVIPPVIGPIARSVEDCALFMKAVLIPRLFEGDLNLAPLPFNDSEYQSTRKLRIGYFYSDEWFEPCPTSKRAVQEAVAALTEAGHTCVPFALPSDGWEWYRLLVAINAAEGDMRSFVEALEDEEIIPEYRSMLAAAKLPGWLSWVVRHIIDKRRAHFLAQTKSGGVSVWDLWQRIAELLQMRNDWSDALSHNNLDAIVHPSMPLPAFQHGLGSKLQFSCTYMALANLLLWPSGSVPVTTIRGDEAYYAPPRDQRDPISRFASQVMEGSEGLPISVCTMTGAYQDEKCLRVMRDVERHVVFKANCI